MKITIRLLSGLCIIILAVYIFIKGEDLSRWWVWVIAVNFALEGIEKIFSAWSLKIKKDIKRIKK